MGGRKLSRGALYLNKYHSLAMLPSPFGLSFIFLLDYRKAIISQFIWPYCYKFTETLLCYFLEAFELNWIHARDKFLI